MTTSLLPSGIPSLFDFHKTLDPFTVGYDKFFKDIEEVTKNVTKNVSSYPPYNIKQVSKNKYVIELAVAGFGKQDIEITLDNDKLVVKGESKDDTQAFLYKGIATRAFTRSFAIDDQVVVNNASMVNGMLKIFLERIIPEHKKSRKVEISDNGGPELLLEKEVTK